MPNYTLERDATTHIISCRIEGFLPDAEAEALAADLARMIAQARMTSGKLRLFIDNHKGAVFSPRATEAFTNLRGLSKPGDRTATLVSGAINRLQADRSRSEGTELFTSEAEAMAWLKSP